MNKGHPYDIFINKVIMLSTDSVNRILTILKNIKSSCFHDFPLPLFIVIGEIYDQIKFAPFYGLLAELWFLAVVVLWRDLAHATVFSWFYWYRLANKKFETFAIFVYFVKLLILGTLVIVRDYFYHLEFVQFWG